MAKFGKIALAWIVVNGLCNEPRCIASYLSVQYCHCTPWGDMQPLSSNIGFVQKLWPQNTLTWPHSPPQMIRSKSNSHPANTFDSLGCAETAPQHHPSKLYVQKFRATLQRKAPPIAPCRVTSPSGALGFHFELPRHTLTLLPHDDTVFSA